MTDLRLVNLAERPDLEDALDAHNMAAWPDFMLNDSVADELWHYLHRELAAFQLILLDGDEIMAAANSAPLAWDGTDAALPEGWDDQFRRSAADLVAARPPNTLGALQIVVAASRRGDRLAGRMIGEMRALARSHGYRALIACVRPTEKHRFPDVPIEEYITWRRPDGLPFDAWIRLHVRLGARIVRAASRSMEIGGTIAEWERWTGVRFAASGPQVVPFATNAVEVELAADRAVYHDANVWVVHDLT
jgi:hypothetical protein